MVKISSFYHRYSYKLISLFLTLLLIIVSIPIIPKEVKASQGIEKIVLTPQVSVNVAPDTYKRIVTQRTNRIKTNIYANVPESGDPARIESAKKFKNLIAFFKPEQITSRNFGVPSGPEYEYFLHVDDTSVHDSQKTLAALVPYATDGNNTKKAIDDFVRDIKTKAQETYDGIKKAFSELGTDKYSEKTNKTNSQLQLNLKSLPKLDDPNAYHEGRDGYRFRLVSDNNENSFKYKIVQGAEVHETDSPFLNEEITDQLLTINNVPLTLEDKDKNGILAPPQAALDLSPNLYFYILRVLYNQKNADANNTERILITAKMNLKLIDVTIPVEYLFESEDGSDLPDDLNKHLETLKPQKTDYLYNENISTFEINNKTFQSNDGSEWSFVGWKQDNDEPNLTATKVQSKQSKTVYKMKGDPDENNNNANKFIGIWRQVTPPTPIAPTTVNAKVTKHYNNGPKPSINVTLYQDDVVYSAPDYQSTVELTSTKTTHTYENLPKLKDDGTEYNYTVREDNVPPNYSASYSYKKSEENGITIFETEITNDFNIPKKDISVTKNWINDTDAVRPNEITFVLKKNGVIEQEAKVSVDSNTTTHVFRELPELELDGSPINYTVDEKESFPNYVKEIQGNVINNTYTVPKVNLKVKKIWSDNNNEHLVQPSSIKVKLVQNGVELENELELSATNKWEASFANLDKLDPNTGNNYNYSVKELDVPKQYEESYKKVSENDNEIVYNITNTLKTTSYKVSKNWNDDADSNNRPSEISIKLLRNNDDYKDYKLEANKNWELTINNLLKVDNNGKEYTYSVREVSNDPRYVVSYNNNLIINTLKTRNINVIKNWNDLDNSYNTRPNEINIQLKQDNNNYLSPVKLTKENDYKYSFNNLPKLKADGSEYNYTIEEIDNLNQYTSSINYDDLINGNINITNSLKLTSLKVSKNWVDENNKYNLRPDSITINLYKDNTKQNETIILNEANNYTASFNNLLKVDTNGNEINYSANEETIPNAYTMSKEIKESTNDNPKEVIITNTLKTKDFKVVKEWRDNENEYKLRPDSIKIELRQNGLKFNDEVELNNTNNFSYTFTKLPIVDKDNRAYTYTVVETSKLNAYNVSYETTNLPSGTDYKIVNALKTKDITIEKRWVDDENHTAYRPKTLQVTLLQNAKEFKTITLNEDNQYRLEVKGLPSVDSNGDDYNYTLREDTRLNQYTTTYNNFEIINTLKTKNLTVSKIWNDSNDLFKVRPESISIQLKQNNADYGSPVSLEKTKNYSHTFNKLPLKDANGDDYTYTVVELDRLNQYELTDTTISENSIRLTNSIILTNISVKKEWQDDNNKYQLRPSEVSVKLYQDNKETNQTVKLNNTNTWTHSFDNLLKFNQDGSLINYDIREENLSPSYRANSTRDNQSNLITITNSLDTINFKVIKEWQDLEDRYGIRPSEIEIQLKQDDKDLGAVVKLSRDTNYEYTFMNLPKTNSNGKAFKYSVIEKTTNPSYRVSYSETGLDAGIDYKIINSLETTSLTINKIWDDDHVNDPSRPSEIKVELYRNGEKYDGLKTITESDGWTIRIPDLLKYDNDGREYVYTFKEVSVPKNYNDSITGNNLTNTLKKFDLVVNKSWDDLSDRYNTRADSVNIKLTRNGQDYKTATLHKDQNYSFTFKDLPLLDKDGTNFDYAVVETDGSKQYDMVDYKREANVISFTNRLKLKSITINKHWDDENDKYHLRPNSIELNLLRNGAIIDTITLDNNTGFTKTINNLLAVDENGIAYNYDVNEVNIHPSYTSTKQNANDVIELTNSLKTRNFVVKKIWNDFNDEYQLRPTSIRVQLKQNDTNLGDEIILDQNNNFTHSYNKLPLVDAHNNAFNYSVVELSNPQAYNITYNNQSNEQGVDYEIINTLKLKDITIEKNWLDDDNHPEFRPNTIKVTILQNGKDFKKVDLEAAKAYRLEVRNLPSVDNNGADYVYSLREDSILNQYDVSYQDYTITNTLKTKNLTISKRWEDLNNLYKARPDSIKIQLKQNGNDYGKPIELKAAYGYSYTYEKLPLKDTNGIDFEYTVVEIDASKQYQLSETISRENSITLTNSILLTNLSVKKEWNDQANKYLLRPDSINVALYNNNVKGEVVTLNDANQWTHNYQNLLKFDADGNEIQYDIREEDLSPAYSSNSKRDNDNRLITITNSLNVTNFKVKKEWNDLGNSYNIRPDEISIQLKQNNKILGEKVKLTKLGDFEHSFTDLPKFDNTGTAYVYSVEELSNNPSYVVRYEKEGLPQGIDYKIVNSLQTTNLTINKLWNDDHDNDPSRPNSIEVEIYRNGLKYGDTKTISAADNWTITVRNLLKYDSEGNEYNYSFREINIPNNYESSIDGNNITNNLKRFNLTVIKSWDDLENKYTTRPNSVIIKLLRNDLDYREVSLDNDKNYTHEFKNLPLLDHNGNKYNYRVVEKGALPQYEMINYKHTDNTISFTNKLKLKTYTLTKIWNDENNKYGLRPSSASFELLRNNIRFGDLITLDENSGYTKIISNLLAVDDRGTDYTYDINEVNTHNSYTNTKLNAENSTTITNNLKTTDFSIKKTWNDFDDELKLRPISIKVQLKQNDQNFLEPVILNEENNWEYNFVSLPSSDELNNAYNYTVVEVNPSKQYEVSYQANSNGYDYEIINNLKTTTFTVNKLWNDDGNEDLRSESIELILRRNGLDYGEKFTLPIDGKWTKEFINLPRVDENGKAYLYSVKEINPSNQYTVTYDGGNITNTLKTRNYKVIKEWIDNNDHYGIRPNSININLLRNNEIYKNVNLDLAGNWQYEFTNLVSVDENGKEYNYSAIEVNPSKQYNVSYIDTDLDEGINLKIVNSLKTKDLTINKVWRDEAYETLRPKEIKVQLLRNDNDYLDPFTISANENWTKTISNLLTNDEDGNEYSYSFIELDPSPLYDVSYSANAITNSIKTRSFKLVKEWLDLNNLYNTRSDKVKVILTRNNEDYKEAHLNETNNWMHTFNNLLLNDELGNIYNYDVKEINHSKQYDVSYIKDNLAEGIDVKIVNSLKLTSYTINKTFDDNGYEDLRPDSIKVKLIRNNVELDDTINITKEDNWTKTIDNLLKVDSNGNDYNYSIKEIDIPNRYTASINGNSISNTLKRIDISVNKVFEDHDNKYELRPKEIKVQLLRNNEAYLDEVTLNEANNWSYAYKGLAKYDKQDKEYTYSIKELDLSPYYAVKYDYMDNNFIITNTLKTTSYTIEKLWDDNDDNLKLRPESIKVQLYRNDLPYLDIVELNKNNNYTCTFNDLIGYDQDNNKYDYKAKEVSDNKNYQVSYNHLANKTIITNTLLNYELVLEKLWDDYDNRYNTRPKEFKIELYQNNKLYKTLVLDSNTRKHVLSNLPKYDLANELYNYHIKEIDIPKDYKESYDETGFIITNKLIKIPSIITNPPSPIYLPDTGYHDNNIVALMLLSLAFITYHKRKTK